MGSSPHQSVAGEGGCATPLSALSSREGTPIPPPQKIEEAAAPNVDISRVQIDETERRSMMQHQSGFMKSDPNLLKPESNDFLKQESTVEPMKEEPPSYDFMKQDSMGYQKQESVSFNDNFHKYIQEGRDQQQVMLHQQQQQQQLMPHHHMQHHHQYPGFGGNNNNPLSPSASDGANNNLLSRQSSITLQQRANNIYGAGPHSVRGLQHAAAYHQTHPGNYGSTIHYHGAASIAGTGTALGVSPSSGSGRTAGATARGGSQVKIGRRPSHLPKVLKFQDGTLPPGWVRKLKCRKHGKQAGRWDVYIYSPCGVKFASRKKLKSFFEKNNLNYDPEDFDFTPYGRHSDHGPAGRGGGGSSGGAGSSGGGRHNSSGSTGSEATHAGSSPASLHNYSPTHLGSSSSSSYLAHSMMTGGFGGGTSEYTPFGTFDPHMENPPNANALDIQRIDSFGTNATLCSTASTGMSDVLVRNTFCLQINFVNS
jgi:hypothetical protein